MVNVQLLVNFNQIKEIAMINRKRGPNHQVKIEDIWEILKDATRFRGIVLTVPVDKCDQVEPRGEKFQLRCWRADVERTPHRGHINGGDGAIFEVLMDLDPTDEHWKSRISLSGVDVNDIDEGMWVRELCTAQDGSQYYNITFQQR